MSEGKKSLYSRRRREGSGFRGEGGVAGSWRGEENISASHPSSREGVVPPVILIISRVGKAPGKRKIIPIHFPIMRRGRENFQKTLSLPFRRRKRKKMRRESIFA